MITLDMDDICSEGRPAEDSKHAGTSEEQQDCHPVPVNPADAALLLPPSQDSAESASSAEWTVVSHGQLAAYSSLVSHLGVNQQDIVLTQTSPAEPLGMYQLVVSLFAGAAMLPANAVDAHEMVSALTEHHVTVCMVTADELQDWLHAGLSSQVGLPLEPRNVFEGSLQICTIATSWCCNATPSPKLLGIAGSEGSKDDAAERCQQSAALKRPCLVVSVHLSDSILHLAITSFMHRSQPWLIRAPTAFCPSASFCEMHGLLKAARRKAICYSNFQSFEWTTLAA